MIIHEGTETVCDSHFASSTSGMICTEGVPNEDEPVVVDIFVLSSYFGVSTKVAHNERMLFLSYVVAFGLLCGYLLFCETVSSLFDKLQRALSASDLDAGSQAK